MTFLNSAYLWALVLVAVPIIIHLFNFQRPKKVYFTQVSFLKEVRQVANARNKLKHLLVLLMRILAITCLVLAFAQPVIRQNAETTSSQSNYVSLYIDNSFSMQNERDDKPLLDIARSHTDKLLQSFPKSTLFQILDNSFANSLNYFYDRSKTIDKMSTLDFSSVGRHLNLVYQKQQAALNNHAPNQQNRIFFISDFQKQNAPALHKLQLDTTNLFYLLPISPNDNHNLYIDSVWLENPFIRPNQTNSLHIDIKNTGKATASEKLIKLFIDEKQVASKAITVSGEGKKSIVLNFVVNTSGTKNCKVVVEDYPIIFDNTYYFSLQVAPQINIVSISDSPKSNYIQQVFQSESFFKNKHYNTSNLNFNSLQKADLVILIDIKHINQALQKTLQQFTQNKQGAVVIFPSAESAIETYRSFLPVSLKKNKQKAEQIALNTPNKQNPFYEGVFDRVSPSMSMPKASNIWQWNGGHTILKFRNGTHFMSRFESGNSMIYLFSTPLSDKFTNFAKHALFVPTMYKIALKSKNTVSRLAYRVGEANATILLDSISTRDVFMLKHRTTAHSFIPAQRVLTNRLVLEIPKEQIQSGNYTLIRQKDKKPLTSISFNYDTQESELDHYTFEELETHFASQKNVKVINTIDEESVAKNLQLGKSATALWRYFLLAALLMFLIETLIIRFG